MAFSSPPLPPRFLGSSRLKATSAHWAARGGREWMALLRGGDKSFRSEVTKSHTSKTTEGQLLRCCWKWRKEAPCCGVCMDTWSSFWSTLLDLLEEGQRVHGGELRTGCPQRDGGKESVFGWASDRMWSWGQGKGLDWEHRTGRKSVENLSSASQPPSWSDPKYPVSE